MSVPWVFASRNANKRKEVEDALRAVGVVLLPPGGASEPGEVEETEATFEGNALLKARAWALSTGCPALADDSGLIVDALGGRPGVHSARYGGAGLTDAQRWVLLLEELRGVAGPARSARFVAALAWVSPAGEEQVFHGTLEGAIAEGARGAGGFGYDPVFVLPDGRTLAELPRLEKAQLSHRAKALAALIVWWRGRAAAAGEK